MKILIAWVGRFDVALTISKELAKPYNSQSILLSVKINQSINQSIILHSDAKHKT